MAFFTTSVVGIQASCLGYAIPALATPHSYQALPHHYTTLDSLMVLLACSASTDSW